MVFKDGIYYTMKLEIKLSEGVMSNLNDIKKEIVEFIKERNWEQFYTPKNLAIAIGAEAGELLECFQWKTDEDIKTMIETKEVENMSDEIADIVIYSISLCNSMNIDLDRAILEKIKKNGIKYPVEKCIGSSKKYSEL
jgi:NTP pyrophosphatase (non-canonical NTP hydrolase)